MICSFAAGAFTALGVLHLATFCGKGELASLIFGVGALVAAGLCVATARKEAREARP